MLERVTPISRRRWCLQFASAAALVSGWSSSLCAQETPVEFRWIVPREKLDEARAILGDAVQKVEGDPSTAPDTRGLPVLYVLFGLMILPEFAKGMVAVYKDWKFGATVVDASNGALSVTHDPKGNADVVIIKSTANSIVEVIDGRSRFDSAKWLEVLTRAQAAAKAPSTGK